MTEITELDPISELVEEAKEYNIKGKVQFEQGDFNGAFMAVTQSLIMYQEALDKCGDEEGELQDSLRGCIMTSSKLLVYIRNRLISSQAQRALPSAATGYTKQLCQTGETDFGKQFESKIESWVAGEGLKAVIGLSHLKSIFYDCLLLLPGSKYATHFSQKGGGSFNQHILLVGIPGNGKTKIVEQYHKEAKGASLIKILPSDILDRYIGEAEKRLASLFEVATKNTPVIIFFDEIDGLFGTTGPNGVNMSLINQFLLLIRSAPDVQIIGATNRPWVLEESIRRRFDHIVHVPLPNRAERAKVFEQQLSAAAPSLTWEDFYDIAEITKGYSCSDLSRAAKECLKTPFQKVSKAYYFREIRAPNGRCLWTPCVRSDTGAVRKRFTDFIDVESICFPSISMNDLSKCVEKQKKTSEDSKMIGSLQSRMLEFANKFGTDGRYGCTRKFGPSSPKPNQSKSQQTVYVDYDPTPQVCNNNGSVCPSAFELWFLEVHRGKTVKVFTSVGTQVGSENEDKCYRSSLDAGVKLNVQIKGAKAIDGKATQVKPNENRSLPSPAECVAVQLRTVDSEEREGQQAGKSKLWTKMYCGLCGAIKAATDHFKRPDANHSCQMQKK